MDRYVVVAKILRQEQNGESHQDGRQLWTTFFEERSFTFTGDQPISAIFERLSRRRIGDPVVEIRLFDDESKYPMPDRDEKDPVF